MKKISSSRKNKKWRRRKAKKALLKRNQGLIAFSNKMKPLTRQERRTVYKWKMRNLGMFGNKTTARARRAAIAELDRKLGFKA